MFSMVQVVLAVLLAVTGTNTSAQPAPKPLSYEEAIKLSQKENRPLLIIVGAKWCAACEVMKRETVEPMRLSGELNDVIVSYVDKDEKPELSQKLMKGETLPQIVMFCKEDSQWKKLSLTGLQNRSRMQELIARALPATSSQVKVLR
jgi:thiol:disulfide interchange protein